MKRLFLLSLIVFVIAFFVFFGCQKNKSQSSINSAKIMQQFNNAMNGSFDKETAQQKFQILIDSLSNEVLPTVYGKDEDETNEIIQYFEGIKTNANDHVDDEDNLIETSRMFMRMLELFARAEPNDFDTNLIAVTGYIHLATSVGGYDGASKKVKNFNQEFNAKGVQAAKALVENFPNNPMSYGQLAHTTLYTGGDEKEVLRQLNKCLEVDKNFQYCKEFLEKMKDR